MITIKIPLFTSLESMGDTRMYLLCYHHTEFHFVKNINMHLTNYLTTKKVLFISEIVDYDPPPIPPYNTRMGNSNDNATMDAQT